MREEILDHGSSEPTMSPLASGRTQHLIIENENMLETVSTDRSNSSHATNESYFTEFLDSDEDPFLSTTQTETKDNGKPSIPLLLNL